MPVFDWLRKWRRERVLPGLGDSRRAVATRPAPRCRSSRAYDADELHRLRALVVLFLDAKAIVGARGHVVTPVQRVIIAIQACVLVLNLDLAWYDDFENVIVYPDEFVPGWEYEDEAGVVHRQDGAARRRGDAAGTR